MREIKFRVWDKEKNKFVYDIDGVSLDGQILDLAMGEHGISNRNRNVELMQFTGLKDKNGKEIYEGDVVKTINGYPATVSYDEEHAEFDPFGAGENSEWGDGVEVIGNIYESPELLDKTK